MLGCVLLDVLPLLLLPILMIQCKPKTTAKTPPKNLMMVSVSSRRSNSSMSSSSQPEIAKAQKMVVDRILEANSKAGTPKTLPEAVPDAAPKPQKTASASEEEVKKSREKIEKKMEQGSREQERKKKRKKLSMEKVAIRTAKSDEKARKPLKKKRSEQCQTAKDGRKKAQPSHSEHGPTSENKLDRTAASCTESKKTSYFEDQNDDDTLRCVQSIE